MAFKLNPISGQWEDDGTPDLDPQSPMSEGNDILGKMFASNSPMGSGEMPVGVPDVPDIQSAPKVASMRTPNVEVPEPQVTKEDVYKSVADKYGLGNYSSEARNKISEQNDKDASGLNWGAGLAALGAGLQGRSSVDAGQSYIKAQQDRRSAKLADFDKAREGNLKDFSLKKGLEDEDPNSEASQRFKSTLKSNFPQIAKAYGPSFDKLTASDSKSVFQVAETKAKIDESHARSEQARAYRDAALSAKDEDRDNKQEQKLSESLDAGWKARGGQAGKVQSTINSAERLEGLLSQFPDGNVPPAQTVELASATAGLINGGSAQSQHQIDSILPQSAKGDINKAIGWYMNDPRGAGQQKFIKLIAETAAREKEIAQDQKRQWQIESLAGFDSMKNKNPDRYNRVLSSKGITPDMIDENGRYKKKGPEFAPDVLDYARKHGISPQQAQQIKSDRGG